MRNVLVQNALRFATEKHEGQQYGDNSFISHPLEVYTLVRELRPVDFALQAAALLHDTLEDTSTSPNELREKFGEEITDLVIEVTKLGYNTFPNLKTQRGIILKFADRLCNLSHMEGWPEDRKQQYIAKSKFWKI